MISLWTVAVAMVSLSAQTIDKKIEFCGSEYGNVGDSIILNFNVLRIEGSESVHIKDMRMDELNEHLHIFENGQRIPSGYFYPLSGVRIPKETTISVLVDRGIDPVGKEQIVGAVRDLVNSAPDSCIYLSFFGEEMTQSKMVTSRNFEEFRDEFSRSAGKKFFYSALYSKLLEFNEDKIYEHHEYLYDSSISQRSKVNPDKAVMFIFVDGSSSADTDDPIQYNVLTEEVGNLTVKPTIYAFYYLSNSSYKPDEDVESTLSGITKESGKMKFPPGRYVPSSDNQEIFLAIGKAIEDQKCDYAFIYKAALEAYTGKVSFYAKWDDQTISDTIVYTIGTPENPWPIRKEAAIDVVVKYCIALLTLLLTIAFFFAVMKILIPYIKSKIFSVKYYKRYEPEYGIQERYCIYCKRPIEPGQMVVKKCKHIIHVHCWKENDYRCAEYGQNCNSGIQSYVDWKNLFTKTSFRDCYQAISGICAGFVSWLVYELMGRGAFSSLAAGIGNMFLTDEPQRSLLLQTCASKVSSFLAIGMLLGFFLSLIFRWNEEYRKKNFAIYMKMISLSLLSSFIGLLAFAFGGIILCVLVSSINVSTIPWYCSLPAYILFSVCVSLSLTIKTSIPIKSAMLGGVCSSIIGFLVLYFTTGFSSSHPWMNMLLDFIIYGGGLGASLVTVRMLAEKYFLVIKNGLKAGTRIPIHKWMNATGGGNKVTIGMTGDCEIQMNWEKSNKVAKEHAVLYIDQNRSLPIIKPLATNVIYNSRVELPVRKSVPLINGDTFKIGDTIFLYEEKD